MGSQFLFVNIMKKQKSNEKCRLHLNHKNQSIDESIDPSSELCIAFSPQFSISNRHFVPNMIDDV